MDMRVPMHIANKPKPIAPDVLKWTRRYREYLLDLACWKAMKADCFLFGVKEDD